MSYGVKYIGTPNPMDVMVLPFYSIHFTNQCLMRSSTIYKIIYILLYSNITILIHNEQRVLYILVFRSRLISQYYRTDKTASSTKMTVDGKRLYGLTLLPVKRDHQCLDKTDEKLFCAGSTRISPNYFS